MEGKWLWYLSGAFDTAGNLAVKIQEDDRYSIGYKMTPKITFTRESDTDAIFGMIDEYCEENQVRYFTRELKSGKSTRIEINNPESIERFLEPIIGGMFQQREAAELMLNEILSAVEDGKHTEKESFYELMGVVDELREVSAVGYNSKYTQDYFMKEWKMR